MTDNSRLAPTHYAIKVWRNLYFAGHVPAIGYPSENVIYRLMRGTALTSGPDLFSVSERESLAQKVQDAVGYLKWRYDKGEYAENLADPFIAHHLHVIRGQRAMRDGKPMPATVKANILGLSRRTYYRRIDAATEFIHSVTYEAKSERDDC